MNSAIVTTNRFCGPTSISALTGLKTSEASAAVRLYYPELSRVKGLLVVHLIDTLRKLGLRVAELGLRRGEKWGTLRRWAEDHTRRGATYLVLVTNHYVVVRDGQIVCTQFKGQIRPLSDSKHLRRRVQRVWEVSGDCDVEEIRRKLKPPSKRKLKRSLKSLTEEFNLEVDVERIQGGVNVWVWWPQEAIETLFGGVDPFGDTHCFCDSSEAVDAILDAVKEMKSSVVEK